MRRAVAFSASGGRPHRGCRIVESVSIVIPDPNDATRLHLQFAGDAAQDMGTCRGSSPRRASDRTSRRAWQPPRYGSRRGRRQLLVDRGVGIGHRVDVVAAGVRAGSKTWLALDRLVLWKSQMPTAARAMTTTAIPAILDRIRNPPRSSW